MKKNSKAYQARLDKINQFNKDLEDPGKSLEHILDSEEEEEHNSLVDNTASKITRKEWTPIHSHIPDKRLVQ